MRTDVAFAVPMANVYRNVAPSSSRGTGELVLQLLDAGGHVQRQDALQVLEPLFLTPGAKASHSPVVGPPGVGVAVKVWFRRD